MTLTLRQSVQFPRKVSYERFAISDVTRATAFAFDPRCVLDSLEVHDRRARGIDVGKSDCFGDHGHALSRFIANQYYILHSL